MTDIKNKVTVLMAVYNDGKYMANAVKSILNQTYNEFEFLIIDDGSTESIGQIAESFKDSRIKYEKISRRGLAGALNFGLKISKGDWIARIDADDLSPSHRLTVQMNYLKMNPHTDVLSGWSVYFEDPDKILFEVKPPTSDIDIKEFMNLHNPINHSAVVFKKNIILDGGGYNEDFKSFEDYELWLRMKDRLNFRLLPEVLVYTRLRKNSLTQTGSKKKIYDILSSHALYESRESKSTDKKNYWNNVLFWIEYFYGDKSKSRKYLTKDISFKQAVAFLNTFLPVKTFNRILGLRLRYRLQSKFTGNRKFKNELNKLINS